MNPFWCIAVRLWLNLLAWWSPLDFAIDKKKTDEDDECSH